MIADTRVVQLLGEHRWKVADSGLLCACGFRVAGVIYDEAVRRMNTHVAEVIA